MHTCNGTEWRVITVSWDHGQIVWPRLRLLRMRQCCRYSWTEKKNFSACRVQRETESRSLKQTNRETDTQTTDRPTNQSTKNITKGGVLCRRRKTSSLARLNSSLCAKSIAGTGKGNLENSNWLCAYTNGSACYVVWMRWRVQTSVWELE